MKGTEFYKRLTAAALTAAIALTSAGAVPVFADDGNTDITDKLIFGDTASEKAHDFTEKYTISGTDAELSEQYKDEGGTWQGGATNRAYISELTVDADFTPDAINIGDTVNVDFSASDAENDSLSYSYNVPDESVINGNIVTFTPKYGGDFWFNASVNDAYHENPTEKTVKIKVNGGIDITIDGRPLKTDVPAYIENGVAYVPIRAIAERLGADVSWDEDSRTATLENDEVTVELKAGTDSASANGKSVSLEKATVICQGRIMIPLRFVADAFGCNTDWNSESNTALITTE